MAKYENIRALAKKQLQAVTESSDRWKAFLRTAAIAYNYSFPNQLLIHEQSPTATAVADIAYWNNNAGRWVKRGAHGIAVFDTRANSSRLRYLFDISDTIPRAEIPEALPWVITDQNWRPVWDKIVADNHADSIQSALLMLSTSCVAQRSAMFTTALGKAIDGSSLQWAKLDEQRQLFLQLITQSCLYMAALRCGVDTARLDLSALESVNQFDTNRITLCLGSACQQAARPLMQQIGSITREIDSVARAEKVRYYGDKQEETNNTKEVNNGVHDGERLPNPGADAERAADAGNREVRQPAAEIPAGERPDDVRRDDAGGNAVPASGGDGQRSTPANRTDHADADAAEHRPEPADRPDGLDAVDERLAGSSRGTGDAADLQPVIQEPQAESDTTPSAFSVPISDLPPLSDELILGLLAKESSSRADNAAILEYFNEHPDLAERSAFCKHCYKQIYTYLFVDDHTVGFIRHDMYLELWEGNYLTKTAQINLTWDAVAAKIADLIGQGRLIVPIKAAPVPQQMEQLTLTPEYSEKAGLPSYEQQVKNIDLVAEAKKWNKPMPQRSAQLVFCDLSTPKAGVFNVYDDMKAKLIERGIPETEIAFIHEANTDARKTELFGKVRSGAVRVLMGSTAKMGAGTNVQQRLVALHHLDIPWRPSDIEQREGRILRQGNENKEVYVFRYVTEGTFDAYSWQLIENKQKFIGQIMTSKSPARSCNDMDEAALSYAEVKALAAGNPLIKEKMDLDVQLTRLKTLKAAHDSQRYELENKIAIGFPAEIRKCKEQIENATVDAATVKEHSAVDADGKDVFCIQLEKKVYYEKEPAGKALLGLLGLALNSEKPVPIGYFKGMELQIQHLPFGNEYHARLAGSGTYSTQLGADVLGNLTRLSNLANGIEPSIEKTRNMQIQLEQQLASAEEEVKRPFPQATELTEKSKRLAVLEGLLNMNDKDIVTDTEPEQQCQTDNRQRGQEER